VTAYAANHDGSGIAGLTSSLARSDPVKYSVAYANGSDPSAINAGINVPPGMTLVRPVLAGDANMDGKVNFFDLSQVLGYKYNTGAAASYTDGDLNYDGKVNFFDLSIILSSNYNSGQTLGPAGIAAAPSYGADVPEPCELASALIGALGLLRRPRRRPPSLRATIAPNSSQTL
jgi:hypothetical protein